jgi:hypothetical protein
MPETIVPAMRPGQIRSPGRAFFREGTFRPQTPPALARSSGVLVWRKTSLHWSSCANSIKRHFPIPNQEQQPQGLRKANQDKTDSYCLDR